MLAYQMIYTACGKDKTGAFSVWSQSKEITKAESDEIIKLMPYKKPKNAPYDPTPEDIKTLFPQKYGYFVLSSGRKCFAKSTYIGQVYSDLDGRSGNFIIHAYVFDNLEDCCPFGVPNSDLFLKELTYEQWHDAPAPENLPAVQISVKDNLTEDMMKRYLQDPQKADIFARILQSAMNCADNDKVVTFNASEDENKLIYALLGKLLPPKYFDKLTFSNQYSPQSEYSLQTNGVPPVKIRNVFDSSNSAVFNFEDEINLGNYAFNYERSLFADVPLGVYASEIVKSAATKSFFDTLKRVDDINAIMQKANCSADVALDIGNFLSGNYGWFRTVNALTETIDLVAKGGYKDKASCAKAIYATLVIDKKWGFDLSTAKALSFVYQNIDDKQRAEMLFEVINNLGAFGVTKTASPKEFLGKLQNSLPIDYRDLQRAMLYDASVHKMFAGANDVCLQYAYLDTLVASYDGKKDANFLEKAQTEMLNVLKKVADSGNMSTYKLYLERIQTLGAKAEEYFVFSSFPKLFDGKIENAQNLRFAFTVATSVLSNDDNKVKFVFGIVKNNLTSESLMTVYLSEYEKNKALFDTVETRLKSDKDAQEFLIRKDAYAFKTTTNLTKQTLDKYFKDFYLKGYDDGAFFARYQEYFATLRSDADKLKELFARYETFAKLDDKLFDVAKIVRFIYNGIFAVDMAELLKLNTTYININKINEIHQRVVAMNPSFALYKYDELFAVLLISNKLGKEALYKAIESDTVYGKIIDDMDGFASSYLNLIIKTYVEVQSSAKLMSTVVLKSLIYPVVMKVREFGVMLKEALKQVDANSFYVFMADIMAYGFNQKDEFANKLKKFATDYIEESSRSNNKKLFAKVEKTLSKEEYTAIKAFESQYSETHKSFFEKLFGKKKKK